MSYRYSLLRFVPDPARGEFINIGAIAGDDDSGDWDFRQIQNPRRAKAIDENGRLGAALSFVDRIEEHLAALDQLESESEPMSHDLLDKWADVMRNVVQVTPPQPVVADTSEDALDLIFKQLILDPAALRFPFEKKHRAVGRTRQAYRELGVPDESIARRAPVLAGPYRGGFDFAVFNSEVVQLVQCWSFQLPDQEQLAEEVKAWAWVVRELRRQGGTLRLPERELPIPESSELDIAAVYIPPKQDQEAPAYDEARAAFEETQVTLADPEHAESVAATAAERLAAALK